MRTNTLGVWRPDRHAHDSQGLADSSSTPLSPATTPSPGRLYVACYPQLFYGLVAEGVNVGMEQISWPTAFANYNSVTFGLPRL